MKTDLPLTPEAQQKGIEGIRASLEGRRRPIRVLVVEDDEKDAELTIAQIASTGAIVEWAKDTYKVEQVFFMNPPDMVFLDLNLGGTSGVNVLNWIMSLKRDCTVVVLTGAYAHDSVEVKEALKAGAMDVMLKPLTEKHIRYIFGTP